MKLTFVSHRFLIGKLLLAFAFSCSDTDEVSLENAHTDRNGKTGAVSNKALNRARAGATIFDGLAGDPISLATGKAWAANYKAANPKEIRGHYFGREIIQQILDQTDCSGIRMYYALDDKGIKQLLLVGVDFNGNDQLPIEGIAGLNRSGNVIADASFPCPSYCPDDEF
jgi:hypothetical protein